MKEVLTLPHLIGIFGVSPKLKLFSQVGTAWTKLLPLKDLPNVALLWDQWDSPGNMEGFHLDQWYHLAFHRGYGMSSEGFF